MLGCFPLKIMNRFTRWPEAIPMPDKQAKTVWHTSSYHNQHRQAVRIRYFRPTIQIIRNENDLHVRLPKTNERFGRALSSAVYSLSKMPEKLGQVSKRFSFSPVKLEDHGQGRNQLQPSRNGLEISATIAQ
ncbi:unnamed protein product [Protopolystoma xenopodis]|uniref:Uncharacterized protein n=1 Tax=Protopolystoma xenopodis TaxID=117903 RepID=A0A448WSZ0_9PLAT|nr:unnamed protein product [Protopolystoma xenopodis]